MLKWFDRKEWFNFAVLLFLLTMAFFPVACFLFWGKLPGVLLREDGIYESTAAVLCFVGGLLFFVAFYYSHGSGRQKRNKLLLLFAIALLFLAGEEISWGQRIFGFHGSSINYQNEFNFHNSKLIQSTNNIWSEVLMHLLTIYLIILPLFLAVFPSISKIFVRMRIPVPSLLIALCALLAKFSNSLAYRIGYGSQYSQDYFHFGEGFESTFEACLFFVAVECLLKEIQNLRSNTKHS